MRKPNKRVVAVIPAYNEASSIRDIVQNALKYLQTVIVVDDGSTDHTRDQILDLPITILGNDFNQGKDAALLRGFAYAQQFNATGIITIDADKQHNPDDIPNFLQTIQKYTKHIVIGARIINDKEAPRYRKRANNIADFFVSWAAGQRIVDTQSGFRYYPSTFLNRYINIHTQTKHFTFESEVLIDAVRSHFSVISIPIASVYPKDARPSHFRPVKDTLQISRAIGKKILSGGLCLPGLCRILFKRNNPIAKI